MLTTEILAADKALSGFVKIWKTDPSTGESFLVVDKPNLILRGGTKIIAQALGGTAGYNIWGMYIGYNNQNTFTAPNIDVNYTNTFSGAGSTGNFGYLREPLTFTPNYLSTAGGYDSNTVLFSTMVTSATKAGGVNFDTTCSIYEVALIAAPTGAVAGDVVFSRTNFNPIKYDSTYNFTITWGVRILLP